MAIIFHRIIKDNIFPAESFNPFISDNAIEFSKDGIAVVYAPNGVGKTSLANVLEEGAGKNLSFEYDGKTDDPNAFYVIEDQNSRNIIKGDAGEFFVGTKVRDIKYNEQWLDARYEAIRLELRKFLDARNIKLTGHHFADVCGRRNEKLGKYVSDLANRSSQGKKQKYSDFADLGWWAAQQGEQPVIEYDKEKLEFFTAGYGKDGIVDKILELDIAKVTHVEEIRNVERHTDALRILGKFIDSHTCIVCDTEGIDPDALYKRKAEARKNIMSSLDKTTKNIVEGILKTIDDADPFGIKPALYALIENGDAGLFEGVCEELGAYYESMCNEFINELNVLYDSRVDYGIKEKDNLTEREFYWVYRKYLGLISNDTVEFTEDDEKFIRMAVADLMRKDISLKVVDGDNGKRLALYLDGGALLGQDRKYL